jgi:hypothetical protein
MTKQEYFGQDDGVPRTDTAYGGAEGKVRRAKIPVSKLVTVDTSQTALKIECANRAAQDDRYAVNNEFYYVAPGMSRIFTVRVYDARPDEEGSIQVVRNEDGMRCWVHPRNLRTEAEVLHDITAAAPQETVAPPQGAWYASSPDKPGYYWYRDKRSSAPEVVRMDGDGDFQFCGNEIYYRPGAPCAASGNARMAGEFWSVPLEAPR